MRVIVLVLGLVYPFNYKGTAARTSILTCKRILFHCQHWIIYRRSRYVSISNCSENVLAYYIAAWWLIYISVDQAKPWLVEIMVCRLSSFKPSSTPMLAYWWLWSSEHILSSYFFGLQVSISVSFDVKMGQRYVINPKRPWSNVFSATGMSRQINYTLRIIPSEFTGNQWVVMIPMHQIRRGWLSKKLCLVLTKFRMSTKTPNLYHIYIVNIHIHTWEKQNMTH